jgi:predicted enzyme related to lactoylglutathione lyase
MVIGERKGTDMSGQVVHFEIPADDVPRAQAFYREAFGWRINEIPDMNYTIVATTETDETGAAKTPGAINGGMMARQGPITAPVITIDTEDIDATLERVEKLGGAVALPKMAVGEMGFAAYFTDTEGNVVGLWENAAQ